MTADPATVRTVLPRSRPSAQGVNAGGVIALLDAFEAAGLELHSLMVLRHGHVVAEGWWAPYSGDRKHLVYSLSKSFTSTAVGLAADAGLLTADDRVLDHLGAYAPAGYDERYDRLLLRHALSMATGHETETIDRLGIDPFAARGGSSLAQFFSLPPEREPGTVFAYNQMATYCAARCVAAVTGQGLQEWLQPRLFEPFGADEVQWMTFDGYEMGYSGIHVRTETIAALGQLMLGRGRWGDRQLVSAGWVDQASSAQMANDAAHLGPGAIDDPDSDWQRGYGFQFWRSRHGYRGDGAYGQFCIVWPEEQAVVVTTAEVADMQLQLNLINEHLRPAMAGAGAGAEVEQRLVERLAGLALPLPVDAGGACAGDFTVAAPVPDAEEAVPGLRRIRLAPLDDRGGDGWSLTFVRNGDDVTLPVGRGRWAEGLWPTQLADHDPVPFVSAGGFGSDGRLRAELRMIQTPHTLLVAADPASGAATVSWRLPPLRLDGPDGHALPTRR